MKVWDWKYRIYFDNETMSELKEWASDLDIEERKIYNKIIEFYSSFFSFGILFDLMCENPDRASCFLQHALDTSDKIIRTPGVLVPYYKRQINKTIKDNSIKKSLHFLLDLSCSAKEMHDAYWQLISFLFGSSYGEIVEKFSDDVYATSLRRMPKQRIICGNTEKTFSDFYHKITSDKKIIGAFNNNSIGLFEEKIIEGNGYGEWWDREISTSGKDELILYTNNNVVKEDDYFYTIIHETYPGHGHFYNKVRNGNPSLDHGAMILIEGWATYCEWNTYPSKYVDAIRHNALSFLNNSFNLDCESRARLMYEKKRKQGKKISQFVHSIIYATQYIGYLESYYLGALWIEKAIKEKYHTPKAFLGKLATVNKGEFFRLWL